MVLLVLSDETFLTALSDEEIMGLSDDGFGFCLMMGLDSV